MLKMPEALPISTGATAPMIAFCTAGMFGVALLVAVFSMSHTASSAQAYATAFANAVLAAALLSLSSALAGLWLPGRARLATADAKA